MARLFTLAALVVGGLMVADVMTHPKGTAAASKGIRDIETPAIKGLLGSTSGY